MEYMNEAVKEQEVTEKEVSEPEFNEKIETKAQLEAFYSQGFRHSGVAYLRFILMAFVCFWYFGFPEPTGILSSISGFAIPCFFILSGYFILSDSKEISTEKEKRKIKRSLLCFAIIFVLYLSINVLIYVLQKYSVTISPRTVFNFLVLNLWPLPVGSNIWFIQSMLYAYILIFIAEKLNLMRFYKPVLIITMLFMLLSGEFAGLIRFNILGYRFIPGNWLTRALPYILLGKFLREKEERILKIAKWKYIVIWIMGAVLALAEMFLLMRTGFLVYEGHMIGYGIMAVAACGLALSKPLANENPITAVLTQFDPVLTGIIYVLLEPAYYMIGLIFGSGHISLFSIFGSLAALVASILFSLLLKNIKPIKALFS